MVERKTSAPKKPRAPNVKIVVSPELIEGSKARDSSHCMIAEAVKAAIPTAAHVSVDISTIRWSDPAKRERYTFLTPRTAQIGIIQFDQGMTPKSFSFVLREGHVTRMSRSNTRSKKAKEPISQARQEAAAKARRVNPAIKKDDPLAKTDLRETNVIGGVMRRVGGRTPPTTPFARRRAFGLRGLEF